LRHPGNCEQTKLKTRNPYDLKVNYYSGYRTILYTGSASLCRRASGASKAKRRTREKRRGGKTSQQVDISAGIKKNIGAETKKSSDGKFHVKYQDQDLALDLIRVHDDRLSDLGGGKYFACVDMKGTDGKTYDIDFFLTGQPGTMTVTETAVHKIDGKPLYDWKEDNGQWHKVPAG
jgi:hypothetical protein